MKPDILIIGGGVIGSAIAYELTKSGLSVQLLERKTIACGASGMSAAMLEAQLDAPESGPFADLLIASRALFPALASELKDQTGVDIGYEACGILQMAATPAEWEQYRDRYDWQCAGGWKVSWLEPKDVAQKVPVFQGKNHGGIFYAEDGQVIASRLTTALAEAARRKGAIIQENCEVTGFRALGSRVQSVDTSLGPMEGDRIILAAGPWMQGLATSLGFSLPIEPIRGQLLMFQTPERMLPFPVYLSEGYITPKPDGITLVGSTREQAGFNEHTTPEALKKLEAFALERVPALAKQPYLGGVAGLRPGGLPDNLPAIGPLPGWDNVWVAAGHFKNGILLAPITAQIINRLINGAPSPLPVDPFLPSRLQNLKPQMDHLKQQR